VWYVGGVTDENAREVKVKLDFLQPGVTYDAIIYSDAKDASGLPGDAYNPQAYTITKSTLTSADSLTVRMARAVGFALSLREK
jgi:alpha-glucosidase